MTTEWGVIAVLTWLLCAAIVVIVFLRYDAKRAHKRANYFRFWAGEWYQSLGKVEREKHHIIQQVRKWLSY